MSVKLTEVHKGELLTVDNPHYQQLIDSYSHLRGVKIEDLDSKEELARGTREWRICKN